jgi:hypothetical protein
MRIATWNIAGAPEDNKARRERLQQEIVCEGAVDVWVITEPFPMLSLTGFARQAQSTPFRKPWTEIWVREGKGIHSEPIVTTGQQSTRTACVKLTGTDIGSFYIFGTVLPWEFDEGDKPVAPAKTEKKKKWLFCAALEDQRNDWQRIRNLDTDPDVGFCLAGDFNQESFGSWSDSGERGHLDAVLRNAGLTCLTMNATGPNPTKPPLEIDHVCVSNHFRQMPGESRAEMFIPSALSNCYFQQRSWYKAEREPLTDHSGVVVTLVR